MDRYGTVASRVRLIELIDDLGAIRICELGVD
jgi:hypothetical protein